MRVVICDDNSADRSIYHDIINQIDKQKGYSVDVIEYENAKGLLFDMEDNAQFTDVIFLDINMPEINGMQAADKLRDSGYTGELVFITVSRDYMLGAFDVRAYNYIIKGADIERAKGVIDSVLGLAAEKQKEYMLFTGVGEYRNVPISSIKYFEVNQKIVTVYYGNDSFEFVSSIGKLENLLFTKGFVRIHRSFMVAVAAVKRYSYGEVELIDGTKLPVGRKYYASLKEETAKKSEK